MEILKKLFGGMGSPGDPGLYYYVRPQGSEEVVRVRINRNNDLSLADDGKTFWVHKVVMGTTSFQRVELDLFFDKNRQLTDSDVSGGDLVKKADYDNWMADAGETT